MTNRTNDSFLMPPPLPLDMTLGPLSKFERLLGRIETSNAELRGQIGEMNARLAPLSGMKTTVIGTGVAVVALVIAVLTFGQQWFGTGVAVRDTIRATVTEMHVQAPSPPVKP
jgi:hypothetical protein